MTSTVVIAPAPATIKDLKPALVALVSGADLLNAVEVGGVKWLTGLTKAELWQTADVLTTPGLTDAAQWELIDGIRGKKTVAAKTPAASNVA